MLNRTQEDTVAAAIAKKLLAEENKDLMFAMAKYGYENPVPSDCGFMDAFRYREGNKHAGLDKAQTARFNAIVTPFDPNWDWSGSMYGYMMRKVQWLLRENMGLPNPS